MAYSSACSPARRMKFGKTRSGCTVCSRRFDQALKIGRPYYPRLVGEASIRRVRNDIVEFPGRHPALHICPVTDGEEIPVFLAEIVAEVRRHTEEPLPFVHQHIEFVHCEPGAIVFR